MKLWVVGILAAVVVSMAHPAMGHTELPLGFPTAVGPLKQWLGCGDADRSLELGVGYLTSRRNVAFEFSCDQENIRQEYPLNGVWLALSAGGALNDSIGLSVQGSWFVPTVALATEKTLRFTRWAEGSRRWGADIQWYTVDAAMTKPLRESLAAIGGFRFDSFEMNLRDASNITGGGGFSSDEGSVAVRGYLPYVGLALSIDSALSLAVIGFPYAPVGVEFRETFLSVERWKGYGFFYWSHFLEGSCTYRTSLMGGELAAFAKLTYLHGSAPFPMTTYGDPQDSFTLRVSLDRQVWTFGGNFSIDF